MTQVCGQFAGLQRFKARQVVTKELSKLGLLREEVSHSMAVPLCSRTGDVIEPLVRPQWFLNTKELGQQALDAVKEGRLTISPSNYTEVWNTFMGEARDWCLSRQ